MDKDLHNRSKTISGIDFLLKNFNDESISHIMYEYNISVEDIRDIDILKIKVRNAKINKILEIR